MDRRLIVAAGALLALAPALAGALDPVESMIVYDEWDGRLVAGLPVGIGRLSGGPDGAVGAGPVSMVKHAFVANDCHRDLRLRLDYTPEEVAVDSPAAAVAVPVEFDAEVTDASTGKPVHDAPLTWHAPGTRSVALTAGGAFVVQLTLRTGADVAYDLRASGWRVTDAECSWQGRVFITEVEANPNGTDSGHEWVEIHNADFRDVDLTGWRVDALHGRAERLVLPAGTLVPAGGRLVVTFPSQFLDNADEVVTLTAPRGWLVDRTPALSDGANDERSWQRATPDDASWEFVTASPGFGSR